MNTSTPLDLNQHPTQLILSWYDYLTFIIMLGLSTFIGIYYGCFGSKQATVEKYLLGGKKMSVLPIALSVAVGHFSAITLLGIPAEVYKFGAYFAFTWLSTMLLAIMTIYLYFSVFFNLKLTSTYDYLERRFDKKTKLFGSILYILSDVSLMPIVAYAPALALSRATGVHPQLISFVMCGICVFYTTIGGLRAVVWTDFYQFLIILISLMIVSVIGVNTVGGMSTVWHKSLAGGRLDIFDLNPDMTRRDSIWTFLIGYTVYWITHVSLSQSAVQKFLALPTFRQCIWSVICFTLIMIVVLLLCVLIGLEMYAKYSNCDPVMSSKIRRVEEMVPYYIMDIAADIPGVTGLFLVALFCAALSTISSSLNSLSGVIYKDFISHFLHKNVTERKATSILKLIVVIVSVLSLSIILVMDYLGDVLPLALTIPAVAGGPLMGMFTLGVLCPRANAKGAFYGAIGGFIFIGSIVLPLKIYQYEKLVIYPHKMLSTDGCEFSYNSLFTTVHNSTASDFATAIINTTSSGNSPDQPNFLFRISHYYHCVMGATVTIILGVIISYATNKNDPPVDKMLISPIIHTLLPKPSEDAAGVAQALVKDSNI